MSLRGTYPEGGDTVDLVIEGENVVARCIVCIGSPAIGKWRKTVSLLALVHALFQHQAEIARTYPITTPEERDV